MITIITTIRIQTLAVNDTCHNANSSDDDDDDDDDDDVHAECTVHAQAQTRLSQRTKPLATWPRTRHARHASIRLSPTAAGACSSPPHRPWSLEESRGSPRGCPKTGPVASTPVRAAARRPFDMPSPQKCPGLPAAPPTTPSGTPVRASPVARDADVVDVQGDFHRLVRQVRLTWRGAHVAKVRPARLRSLERRDVEVVRCELPRRFERRDVARNSQGASE